MSSQPIMTQSGGTDEFKRQLRQRIEYLERQLIETRRLLAGLDDAPDPLDAGIMEMMRGLDMSGVSPPLKAIEMLLKHVGHPISRREICRALVLGGAKLGKLGAKSVNSSISTNVRKKKGLKLEEPDHDWNKKKQKPENLVGLVGMFGKRSS
jgi:hypothetical protein